MCKLEEEPTTHNFKTYSINTFVYRKKFWTACYRRQAMLNTNIVLEAFHKTLKHVYLKGKKNLNKKNYYFSFIIYNLNKSYYNNNMTLK